MAKEKTETTPLTEEELSKKTEELNAAKEAFEKEKEEFLKEKEAIAKTATAEKIDTFQFEDEDYSFSPKAPEVINYGGQKFTRKELIANKEILLELIGGKSSLIVKI